MTTQIERLQAGITKAKADGDIDKINLLAKEYTRLVGPRVDPVKSDITKGIAARKKKDAYKQFDRRGDAFKAYNANMEWLQKKYGDETTAYGRKKLLDGFLPRTQPFWDEEELLKRYARDKWGSVPPTPGVAATAGKTLADVPYALKQLPELFGGSNFNTPEQVAQKQQEDLIWSAAEHPALTELGAFGLTMLPAVGSGAMAPAMLGKLTGSQTLKGLGHQLATRQAGTASMPKTAAALGAAEGFAGVPHTEEATPEQQWYQRLSNAALAGGTNYGLTHAMRSLPDAINTTHIQNIRRQHQGDAFPERKQVREHPFDLLGDPAAKAEFVSTLKTKGSPGMRADAAENAYQESMRKAVDFTSEEMIGTAKPQPLGTAMNRIMDNFLDVYDISKRNMSEAYKAIPTDAKILVTNKGPFNKWKKTLIQDLKDKNLKLDGAIGQAVTAFQKLGTAKGQKGKSIPFNEVRSIMSKINKAQQRVFSDDGMKDMRPAITELKSEFNKYIEEELWRNVGTRGGTTGADTQAVQAWRRANQVAGEHYKKFHGVQAMDELLDEYNKAGGKRGEGKLKTFPVDIAEDMFVGATNKFDKRTQPRVELVNKFREALKDLPDFNVDRALKEEAMNTLRGGGVKGKTDINTLVTSIDENILTGQHRDLFSPSGYGGKKGIFSAEELDRFKALADIQRRHNDPHQGSKTLTKQRGAIPADTRLGRLAMDSIADEGRFAFKNTSLGQAMEFLSPEKLTRLRKARGLDRKMRRIGVGSIGQYGPQVPPVAPGPHFAATTNEDPATNFQYLMYQEMMKKFPTIKGLLSE